MIHVLFLLPFGAQSAGQEPINLCRASRLASSSKIAFFYGRVNYDLTINKFGFHIFGNPLVKFLSPSLFICEGVLNFFQLQHCIGTLQNLFSQVANYHVICVLGKFTKI
ncbi:MAG: hypothetical protein EPGJADBJ_03379 [Saprospiraceae bacterium]|nr:hypothetical protein [Saprospiraceae bacterium]